MGPRNKHVTSADYAGLTGTVVLLLDEPLFELGGQMRLASIDDARIDPPGAPILRGFHHVIMSLCLDDVIAGAVFRELSDTSSMIFVRLNATNAPETDEQLALLIDNLNVLGGNTQSRVPTIAERVSMMMSESDIRYNAALKDAGQIQVRLLMAAFDAAVNVNWGE